MWTRPASNSQRLTFFCPPACWDLKECITRPGCKKKYLYVYGCFTYINLCVLVHALCLLRPEKGVRSPGTGVTDK
ncbi:rCG51031 [Rattus norvegicus]|uniref:RCG51031 n=1 Tax=Rattus norvegicus TaxID=10116 RepID=A6KGI3_RAT|nr:rCG51031 [Rattus norvegicus]